jgi:pilus assembly protein CpaF
MRVTVNFLDGERLEGESHADSLQKSGFPVQLSEGNAKVIWVSLPAIKYVVLHGPLGQGSVDPRSEQTLPKVVLHFTDGETIRTYRDDVFKQTEEGLVVRTWDERAKSLVRLLIPQQALKGIFFVDAWDARSEEERLTRAVTRRPNREIPVPTSWADDDVATQFDPEVLRLARTYQRRLALERDLDMSSDPVQFEKAIRERLDRLLDDDLIALRPEQKHQMITVILREAIGYGPIDPLIHDATITEIMVNAPDEVYIERNGQILRSQVTFENVAQLLNVIRRIAATVGRRVDETSPMVDARLPDGSRINAVIPPAAIRGPALTIRKFRAFQMGLDDLIDEGTLSPTMAIYLQAAVEGRLSILVSGGTGSGKTTTLNMLGSLIPARERVVTIEDSAELQLDHPHTVALEYRPANVEGKGELTIRQLLRNSLRMRPDRVIVGEVRDAAALDMLQAMNTGHDGSMSTIHANSARDAFSRLETMVLSGSVDLPLPAVRAQIVSAIDLVIHQARLPDGSRKTTQISELRGYDADAPILEDIFRGERQANGTFVFAPTGVVPLRLSKLAFHGVAIPPELFKSPRYEVQPRAQRAAPRPVGRPELTVVPERGAGEFQTTPDAGEAVGEPAEVDANMATPGSLLRRIAERQGAPSKVPLEERIARALGNPEPSPAEDG